MSSCTNQFLSRFLCLLSHCSRRRFSATPPRRNPNRPRSRSPKCKSSPNSTSHVTYTETYPKSPMAPNGGVNTGVYTSELGPGGNSIFNHFHSKGPVGEFDGTIVMAWDPRRNATRGTSSAIHFRRRSLKPASGKTMRSSTASNSIWALRKSLCATSPNSCRRVNSPATNSPASRCAGKTLCPRRSDQEITPRFDCRVVLVVVGAIFRDGPVASSRGELQSAFCTWCAPFVSRVRVLVLVFPLCSLCASVAIFSTTSQ